MMTLRCPACRADNTTKPTCRRCKADLGLLWTLEQQRAAHICDARTATREERFDDALEQLEAARGLRPGVDLDRYQACVHFLARDFETAMYCREKAKR